MAEVQKPKCPKCNSSQFYYRTKTEDWHCVSCGQDTPKNEVCIKKIKPEASKS